MSAAPQLLIQADDLTGAADTAVAFAEAGLHTVVVPWRESGELATRLDAAAGRHRPECLAVDTAGRDIDAVEAGRRALDVGRWAAREQVGAVYKKVDSVLRGHPGAELDALREGLGAAAPALTVVAPAYPALGRTTFAGRQLVDGVAVEAGEGDLVALFGAADTEIVDAESTADLDALAAKVEAMAPMPLLVGSGGLAAAVAARWSGPRLERSTDVDISGGRLIVSVSRTDAALAQVERLGELLPGLSDARLNLRTLTEGEDKREAEVARSARLVRSALDAGGDALLGVVGEAAPGIDVHVAASVINRSIAGVAATALTARPPALTVANGGDPALALCRALDVEALVVQRSLPAGAALSRAHRREGAPLAMVTKSGGFGPPDALAQLCGELASEPAGSAAR